MRLPKPKPVQRQQPLTAAWGVPQGVGKGTYSTRVSDAYGMMHIAAGDLVRAEIKRGSDLGKEVRAPRCSVAPGLVRHHAARDVATGGRRQRRQEGGGHCCCTHQLPA